MSNNNISAMTFGAEKLSNPVSSSTEFDRLLDSQEIMQDLYPIYRRLRDEAPALWSNAWQAWVVSRYDDVAVSLRDKDNLSNENRQALLFSRLTQQERETLSPLRHCFAQKDVIGSDPPDHTRMRALVQKAFTSKTVASLGPCIESPSERSEDRAAANLTQRRER